MADWVKYKDILDEEDLVCARKIGGLIALAAALDSGKQNKIKEISCDLLGDIVIIKCKTEEDASYEIFEANKFSNVFGNTVIINVLKFFKRRTILYFEYKE